MAARILMVDDEENVLRGYHRLLRSRFELDVALGGPQAIRALEEWHPYAVVVADMRMPEMSGLDLFAEMRARFPDTTRIMLTGNADQKTAVDAVNHGQVFRFLTKPCSPEELELAIRAGIRQYELVMAERQLLEQTLTGTIHLLADLLAGAHPTQFTRSQRVRQRGVLLARTLGAEPTWEIEIAALLTPLGQFLLPEAVLQSSGESATALLLEGLPEIWSKLLRGVPRLEGVAGIIRYQAKGYDGSGQPADAVRGDALPLGSRILRVLWDLVELEEARGDRHVALAELQRRARDYDPAVLEALAALLGAGIAQEEAQVVPLQDLRPGMVLVKGLSTASGKLVFPAQLRLGAGHLELLARLTREVELDATVAVTGADGAASHPAWAAPG